MIFFAKAYVEKRQPWRVAATLPKLSLQEVEDESKSLGLYDDDFEKIISKLKKMFRTASNSNGVFENQKMFKSKGLFLL